jgi:hypothetical protein
MPEHLAATLQRVCWDGSTSLTAAFNPPSTSMGPESQNRGKSHQSQKNRQVRRQVGLQGGWMPEHLAATLQRVCWVGSISLMAAPYPPIDVHGA